MIPQHLLWTDRHASELALSTLLDEPALVEMAVHAHVESCAGCRAALVQAAVGSARLACDLRTLESGANHSAKDLILAAAAAGVLGIMPQIFSGNLTSLPTAGTLAAFQGWLATLSKLPFRLPHAQLGAGAITIMVATTLLSAAVAFVLIKPQPQGVSR